MIFEYGLFRIKFISPSQRRLFSDKVTPRDLFIGSIKERPTAELREGYKWHIGNYNAFSKYSGYFAIGRTTISTIEKFNDKTGNFVEETHETSPYTHVVFDANIGFVGIAKKPILSSSCRGIANKLEQLIQDTEVVRNNDILVEVSPIPDPEGFLKVIQKAYRVSKYTATFTGPNPFDADTYFQKPLSVYLSAANGMKGKAQIQGEDLNREVLTEVTKSTAATGNIASAMITRSRRKRPETIHLKGDAAKKKYDQDTIDQHKVLHDLTDLYERVRDNG